MDNWQANFSEVIVGVRDSDSLLNDIDKLLHWFSKQYLAADDFLTESLLSKFTESEIELKVFEVLDELLFTDSNDGFCYLATEEKALKIRHHRLLQVYHPDKGKFKATILNNRTERIHAAYKKIKEEAEKKQVTVTKKATTPEFNFESRIDENLGSDINSSTLKLKVISALLFLSGLLIAFVYMENSEEQYVANITSNSGITEIDSALEIPFYPSEPAESLSLSGGPIDPELTEDELLSLEEFFDSWVDAWQSQVMNSYLNHYSDDFKPEGSDYQSWVKSRHRALTNKGFIKIRISDIEYTLVKGEVIAKFKQQYFSDTIVDEVEKRLLLKPIDKEPHWEILLENTWQ